MKRVFINGRYLTQRVTGVQRVAIEFVLSLDRILMSATLGSGRDVTVLAPTGDYPLPSLKNVSFVKAGRFSGHLWEQIDLPRLARGGLLFNPCGPSPVAHPCQVTMLPDASVFLAPEGYSTVYKTWTQFLYLVAGYRAKTIITISKYSQEKLLERCKTLCPEKLKVVYLGSDHILRVGVDDGILHDIFGEVPTPYVLCVGSQQANKNVQIVSGVSEWLRESGFSTVVTGGSSKAIFREENIDQGCVKKTGYVSDAQLRALYQSARCFIFPSLEEGFGIPPLEAMRCGCPVVASSSASMPEVCGDAAIYFDPRNAESLKSALESVLLNAVLASKMRANGKVQAEKYTWDKCARDIWGHLQQAAGWRVDDANAASSRSDPA